MAPTVEQLPLFPSERPRAIARTAPGKRSCAQTGGTNSRAIAGANTPRATPCARAQGGPRTGWRSRILDIAAETLWPTRCAVCDAPGTPLCATCIRKLPYIDALNACPRCGAPYGRVQCTECNRTLLAPFGYDEPPYDEAVSALVLTERVRRIATIYKDQGERALARPMAEIMARYIPPRWLGPRTAVSFVPASVAARRRRGFDHAEHLARELSWLLEADFAPLLAPPHRHDQRKLGRTGRIRNMTASLAVVAGATVPPTVILVDDICTTGATLFAATEALKAAGGRTIYCATFART